MPYTTQKKRISLPAKLAYWLRDKLTMQKLAGYAQCLP